jgi:hypothetical protein
MASTRFHDDKCRVEKQLQEMTDQGRYMLDVPGNGTKPCFMDDPFIRMQRWGANLRTNTINLDSDLKGLGRQLNHDSISKNNYQSHSVESDAISYPNCAPITDQSRATDPAWMVRDKEQVNWYILPLNPQENTCIPFHNNVSTRILEKDNYIPTPPCISNDTDTDLSTYAFNHARSPLSQNCSHTNSCNRVV